MARLVNADVITRVPEQCDKRYLQGRSLQGSVATISPSLCVRGPGGRAQKGESEYLKCRECVDAIYTPDTGKGHRAKGRERQNLIPKLLQNYIEIFFEKYRTDTLQGAW